MGKGYNYNNRWAAEADAVKGCYAPDARVVAWVRNGYCALALGNDKSCWGAWGNSDKQSAVNRALAECGQRTTGAHLVLGVYSDNTPPEVYR